MKKPKIKYICIDFNQKWAKIIIIIQFKYQNKFKSYSGLKKYVSTFK